LRINGNKDRGGEVIRQRRDLFQEAIRGVQEAAEESSKHQGARKEVDKYQKVTEKQKFFG
jgi:hypothetical protein